MKYKKLAVDMQHMKWEYLKNVPDNYRSDELFYFIPMTALSKIYGPIYTVTKNYQLLGKQLPFDDKIRSAYQEFSYQPIDTPLDGGSIRYTQYRIDFGNYKSNLMYLPLSLSLYRGFNTFLQNVDESMELRFVRMKLNETWYYDLHEARQCLDHHSIISHHSEFCNRMTDHNNSELSFNSDNTIGNRGIQTHYYIPINQTECGYLLSYHDIRYLKHVQSIMIRFNSHEIDLACDGSINDILSNCFYAIRYFEAQKWIEMLNQYTITITFNNDLPEISARGIYTKETGPINIFSLIMASREYYHGVIISN